MDQKAIVKIWTRAEASPENASSASSEAASTVDPHLSQEMAHQATQQHNIPSSFFRGSMKVREEGRARMRGTSV